MPPTTCNRSSKSRPDTRPCVAAFAVGSATIKSSYSCVEVALAGTAPGPQLALAPSAWAAFVPYASGR
ncbi:MAG: DUF397 domain-containing protein [Streptomyces sp.]|uniref:DUF397 domain-containing protein n=1 Tax=Streptomyces sp. TaxID=1931 RepID=UPI0025FD19D6|nr:DUF397 domain-containing protein [Streptomyces sp.]MBW8797067.1 DUF397 domain-containing protein [Streptomyces sp.]